MNAKAPEILSDALLALDNQLCFAVYAAEHALTRAYRELLGPHGLTYPQYLVLLVLWQADDLAVREIGARLMLDSGTLTPLLKRLETAGYLGRARDAADERQVRVRLSAKGRALQARIATVPVALACRMGLAPPDLARLTGELTALRARLDAARSADPKA